MPFALVFIGLVLVITGARGTMRELGEELRADFTGPGNFTWWIASVGVVGALGYVPELRNFSRWFMTLIIIAMIIRNQGFFDKLIQALQSGPETPKTANSNARIKAAADAQSGGGSDIFNTFLKGMELIPFL